MATWESSASAWGTATSPRSPTTTWGSLSSPPPAWGTSPTSSWGSSGAWATSSTPTRPSFNGQNPQNHSQDSFASDIYLAGAYEQFQDQRNESQDVSVTTDRVLNLCVQTDGIAHETLQKMKENNEKIDSLNDDVARIHDDINVSHKKMKQTSSWLGGFATIGSSKTSHQHQDQRVKDERNRMKVEEKKSKETTKQQVEDDRRAAKANKEVVSTYVRDHEKEVHIAKKANMKDAKAANKGNLVLPEEKQVVGGHIFELRPDGNGPKHKVEEQMDQIGVYIHGFHEKAQLMAQLQEEERAGLQNLDSESKRAEMRLRVLNKQADKYCGK